MAEVVIIGAGLTGLSAAYHLEKLGYFDYKIFEKENRPGGLLQSVQQDGYTFDHTGHLLHISDQDFYNFLDSTSNIANYHLITRQTGIFSHNVTTDYPFQINLYGLPVEVAAECIEEYVKRKQKIKNPQTFYDWVCKHFGKGFGKHFFFPYNSKLLAYNIKKIHPSWTSRFVPNTTLNAIIKGTIEKKPPAGIGYNSNFYYPKRGGIEFLIQQLKAQVKNSIAISRDVVHINKHKKLIFFADGHKESYRYLLTTMPLPHLLEKISSTMHSPFFTASQKLLCNTVVNINMGFEVDNISPLHWLYFPEKTFPLYRLGFWNNICPSSVPHGHSAIYGEFSYLPGMQTKNQINKKIDDSINKILSFLHLSKHHITTQKILTLKHAYVIYDAWREKNLKKLLTQLTEHDIYSIGRYGEWKYSSMQEAFFDGKNIAHQLHQMVTPSQALAPQDPERSLVF